MTLMLLRSYARAIKQASYFKGHGGTPPASSGSASSNCWYRRSQQNDIFLNYCYFASIDMVLKGVAESSLLFKDERLTPNIDKVMPV